MLPEIDAELADYALRELRGRGIDIRLGTTLEEVTRRQRPALHRRDAADPHRRLDRRASRRTRACASSRCRSTSAAACRSTTTCGSRAWTRSGRSATAPRPPTRAAASARRPPSTPCARARSPPATSPPSSASAAPEPFDYRGNAAFVNLGRYKAVGRVGGRTFRGFPAWWMARTYHMSQIPGAARKARAVIDWTASLPFRRDISEVGSIGHPKPLEATMEPWDSSTSSSPSPSA